MNFHKLSFYFNQTLTNQAFIFGQRSHMNLLIHIFFHTIMQLYESPSTLTYTDMS